MEEQNDTERKIYRGALLGTREARWKRGAMEGRKREKENRMIRQEQNEIDKKAKEQKKNS